MSTRRGARRVPNGVAPAPVAPDGTAPANGHVPPSVAHAMLPYVPPAVLHLRLALAAGRPWADALLEAVGLWSAPHESVRGHEHAYLISGEAFDWLALAERLLADVRDAVPEAEVSRLLAYGELPRGMTQAAFKRALGPDKHRAHLNYFYGVVVEEALQHAVEQEVLKQFSVRGVSHARGVEDEVMQRLYGHTQAGLLQRFNRETGRGRRTRLTLDDWKAFTYWCSKLRLTRSDPARVASDIQKGLRHLHAIRDAVGG